ncbi:TPA: helix-turn-helix domain-containing protein [Kluyvera ascorbata]|nr:helix-turn-helix domain-containing protein [Kluyvera ascorbata]
MKNVCSWGRVGGRRPKFSQDEWAQMGRLIKGGMDRKQVAIIFDAGVSTLYKKFPAQ